MPNLTDEQFTRLMGAITPQQAAPPPPQPSGSFTRCTIRFSGSRVRTEVEDFTIGIGVFKTAERISDENALAGLPLLLKGEALTWWQGIKGDITTWQQAVEAIKDNFAPGRKNHEIFLEIFSAAQGKGVTTDTFITRKRALLAELSGFALTESQQLDVLFGLLHIGIRGKVARSDVTTFDQLLTAARHQEALSRERTTYLRVPENSHQQKAAPAEQPAGGTPLSGAAGSQVNRCAKCRLTNHTTEQHIDVKKKKAAAPGDTNGPAKTGPPETLACWGCGAPGVFRSRCPTCSPDAARSTGLPSKDFCAMSTQEAGPSRPLVNIRVNRWSGQAYLDTAARTSVASESLVELLEALGRRPRREKMNIALADGRATTQWVKIYTVTVHIKGRVATVDMISLPGALGNATLLGIDALEQLAIVIHTPQRAWFFADSPKSQYLYDRGIAPSVLGSATRCTTHKPSISWEPYDGKAPRTRTPPIYETASEPMETTQDAAAEPEKDRAAAPTTAVAVVSTEIGQPQPGGDPAPSPTDEQWYEGLWDSYYGISHEDHLQDSGDSDNGDDADVLMINDVTIIAAVDVELQEGEGPNLNQQQRGELQKLLLEYGDVFEPRGCPTGHAEHCIDTGDSPPVAIPPYRLSPARKTALKKAVDEMLAEGIISECESPWATQAVLVPKKDGELRCCIDYRGLNKVTVPDLYPMPRIDDLLHATKGPKEGQQFMSTLDLRSGYWQIPIRPEDRPKTSFVTPFGTYMFNVMPFGLRNAGATFQRLADRVKASMPGRRVLAFLDDFAIISGSFEEHLEDLRNLFERFRYFRLRANRRKCRFGCVKVEYLGHLITPHGLLPSPTKTQAIHDMAPPGNLKQLLSFVQTCSWFRRFVPNFAKTAEPLTRLTKKEALWTWGPEQQSAFELLKQQLVQPPILQQADPSQPYVLRTDASARALGAALLQGEKYDEHPVEYASRLLSPAERNYSTTEREALAVVWAVEKYRCYIEGAVRVTVATDHQPLRWLMALKTPTGRLARWALLLQQFNLEVVYTPGKSNVLADLLSRPADPNDSEPPVRTDLASIDVCSTAIDLPRRAAADTRAAQLEDAQIAEIIAAFEESHSREDFARHAARGYLMSGGVLYRYSADQEDGPQLVVPDKERAEILKAYHDDPTAGHYGADITANRIAQKYFWIGMRRQVAEHVRTCPDCQRFKASNLKPAGLLQTPVMQQRFETLAIDLFGPLPTDVTGNRWVLIIEDCASRWVELFALQLATAEACAMTLLNEVVLRYGTPRRLISDQGVQFISRVMQKLTFCLGIDHAPTPAYHPQANPVERKNRDMKAQLAILSEGDHTRWAEKLPAVRFAMNSATCAATGHSAAYLTFGRELRDPDHAHRDLRQVVATENFVAEITPQLLAMTDTWKRAREINEKEQDRRKDAADRQRRPDPGYAAGDLVLLKSHVLSNADKGVTAKFTPKRDGPYKIRRQAGPTSYELEPVRGGPTIGVHHTSALSPYHGADQAPPEPVNPVRRRGRPPKVAQQATAAGAMGGTPPTQAPEAPAPRRGRSRNN